MGPLRPTGLCVFGAALLIAAHAAAQTPAEIDCSGPFAKTASEAGLIKAFGAANVQKADIDVGEGMTEPGTILFPKDPKRRLDILWHDSAKRSQPSAIMIRDKSGWAISVPGEAQTKIRIGTPLSTVETANGGPFTINGFGWDGGGYAGDWRGGRLGKHPAGCTISLRFDPAPKSDPKALDRVNGDKPFASSNANIRAVKPVVSSISLDWGD